MSRSPVNNKEWNCGYVRRSVGSRASSGFDTIPRNLRRSLGRNPSAVLSQPFSFTERSRKFISRKPDRICAEANPLTSASRRKGTPQILGNRNTIPKPFILKTSERGAIHEEKFKLKVAELERNRLKQANFHSKPSTVIYQKPFVPAPSTKLLVSPAQFQLNSDKRARERELFDRMVKQKEEWKEFEQKQAAARRLERDKMDIRESRRYRCFTANPIPVHRAFEVRPSDQPLTVPISPAFTPLGK